MLGISVATSIRPSCSVLHFHPRVCKKHQQKWNGSLRSLPTHQRDTLDLLLTQEVCFCKDCMLCSCLARFSRASTWERYCTSWSWRGTTPREPAHRKVLSTERSTLESTDAVEPPLLSPQDGIDTPSSDVRCGCSVYARRGVTFGEAFEGWRQDGSARQNLLQVWIYLVQAKPISTSSAPSRSRPLL